MPVLTAPSITVPPPPSVSGTVPPPPPKAIEEVKEGPLLPAPQDDFFCEQLAQIGSACEEQCETCRVKEAGPTEEVVVDTIKEIVAQSGIPSGNIIIGSIPKPQTVLEAKIAWRISEVTDLGLTLKGANYTDATNAYGISVDSINNYTNEEFHNAVQDLKKHIESLNPVVEETPEVISPAVEAPVQVDAILDADEKLNIFKQKNRVARLIEIGLEEEEFQYGNGVQAISREQVRTLSDEAFEKEFAIIVKGIKLDEQLEADRIAMEAKDAEDAKVKAEIVVPVKTTEKQKEKIAEAVKIADGVIPAIKNVPQIENQEPKEDNIKQPIVVGDNKTLEDFDFLDRLIATANNFKKTAYAIHLIKNTLSAADLTPAKKIALIENAVNNIK